MLLGGSVELLVTCDEWLVDSSTLILLGDSIGLFDISGVGLGLGLILVWLAAAFSNR